VKWVILSGAHLNLQKNKINKGTFYIGYAFQQKIKNKQKKERKKIA
jgi:hypothetical protein